ncbi:glycosyltransferase WbsX family protein [Methylosinus sp. LW4]|uniref:glycosyltransferase WbsX family protein n=1 Tax=Methylosinus sp. LW4 TaxID=136993 RepID=UPI000A035F91|nr:glycoside hydrolase family 99-like domain-containing protein [Methylosinus sp. LW4]
MHGVKSQQSYVLDDAEGPFCSPKARVIAFYLPQFHPIPENNEWWGAGFTEWTNVAKAKPLYPGHIQPQLPADLGFYDLRVPEVREQQAQLALEAGIEGFCYWHYWFGKGRRILERPFDEMLATGKPEFPFCLAWANQPWTGVWHGNPRQTLLDQTYPGFDDYKAHFDLVLPAFRDPRYMRVDGKPMFLVFDPHHLGQTTMFTTLWRDFASEAGIPGIHFVGMSNKHVPELLAPFDMLTTYGPGNYLDYLPQDIGSRLIRRLRARDFGSTINRVLGIAKRPRRFSYARMVECLTSVVPSDSRYVPCVLPNWDNTPRSSSRGVVFENSTPELFEAYLNSAIERVSGREFQHRIVFLKAWNEWAEGNYVEPDLRHGHGYLEAVRRAVFY